jgi:hypothetical protein
MTDADGVLIRNQIGDLRESQKEFLAGGDVFVIGRESVWPSREWSEEVPAGEVFGTNSRNFVESFKRVAAELDEIDRRRPEKPVQRIVLWHSAVCPSTPLPDAPRIGNARVVWSGGQIKDDRAALGTVFGGADRVTPQGQSLTGLSGTVEAVLKSCKSVEAGR